MTETELLKKEVDDGRDFVVRVLKLREDLGLGRIAFCLATICLDGSAKAAMPEAYEAVRKEFGTDEINRLCTEKIRAKKGAAN